MDTLEIFTLVNRWLCSTYKALCHGAEFTTPLYRLMTSADDAGVRREASRLYQQVQSTMSQIRTACPSVPSGCHRVAFLPVSTYNDETGTTTTPTDNLPYPADCTLAQRLHLQYAEAERSLSCIAESPENPDHGIVPLPETPEEQIAPESPYEHPAPEPPYEHSAPVPSGFPEGKTPAPKPRSRRRSE